MQKTYITAEQLLHDSFALAKQIIQSDYRPTFLIGVWRGGSPIAIAIHEVLNVCNMPCNHSVVAMSSYSELNRRSAEITIQNISHLEQQLRNEDRLLIVDDVHDTGLSMQALIKSIKGSTSVNQIKIAVPYFKPNQSKVDFEPDFYINKSNDWLVFPHELSGLSNDELKNQKPEIAQIRETLLKESKHN